MQMHVHISMWKRARSLGQMEQQSALNFSCSRCVSTAAFFTAQSRTTSIAGIKNAAAASVQLQTSSRFVLVDSVWWNASAMTVKFNLI